MQRIAVVFVAILLAVCGTAEANEGYRFLELNGQQVRWGTPGHGVSLTYRIAAPQEVVSGSVNCHATTGPQALLRHSHLSLLQFEAELRAAFAIWSDVADLHFKPVSPGGKAELVVGAESVPDGIAYSDVTPAADQSSQIVSAIICLNPAALWTAGADPSGKTYRLHYVLAHEVGHVLGLDHPSPSGELMSFEYNPALTNIQSGDIAGIVALYGTSKRPALAFNPPSRPLSPRQK